MLRLYVQLPMSLNIRRFLCSKNLGRIVTIHDALSHWSEVFKNCKVPEPERSIELILAHVTDKKRVSSLYDEKYNVLTPEQREHTDKCCQAKLDRMPLQYIIKEWDFRDLTLTMSPPVFIPRPETEELVEFILDYIKEEGLRPTDLLEIGCGSGAIMLSLLKELKYNLTVAVAIDRSTMACTLTVNNALLVKENRISVIHAELQENGTITCVSNMTNPFQSFRFDIIVSNPPYVPTKDIENLEPEIKLYEDLGALDGGPDGLSIIKPLIIYSSVALKPNGSLFIEVDETHPELIKEWIETNYDKYKLKIVEVKKDFAGKDRFVHIMRG